MKYLFVFLLISSCAHFVKEDEKRLDDIKVQISGIEIHDKQIVHESISSRDKILHRNGHTYASGESMHSELNDMAEIFSISAESNARLTVVYSRNGRNSFWKAASIVTLGIIPYWENSMATYTFEYEKGGQKKTFVRDYGYKSIYSIVLLPASFSWTARKAREEIAEVAAFDFSSHMNGK